MALMQLTISFFFFVNFVVVFLVSKTVNYEVEWFAYKI